MRRRRAAPLAVAVALLSGPAAADEKTACIEAAESGQTARLRGRLRDASASFETCGRDTCPDAIRKECLVWRDEVRAAAPTIVLSVVTADGRDVSDARVALDGSPVEEATNGRAIAIDPGEHRVRIEAPGFLVVEQGFVVREGEKLRAVRAVLTEAPKPHAAVPAAPPRSSSTMTSVRWATVAAAGLGLATTALGLGLGVSARQSWDEAKTICGAGCEPGTAAYERRDDALSAARAATILSVAGIATIAIAIAVFVADPGRSHRVATR